METGRIRRLHALLATELTAATAQARGMLAAPTGGELSARWERDVSVHRWSERVSALTAARSGLCFGRLDHTDGPTSYIGRIGLTDPADGESALIDWRAPAAQPFYCATMATPLGVTRRRHFQLAGTAPDERVATFHDDVLDRAALESADSGSASDPALLAALKAPRGSTMRDIVTTIQAEQDGIIRLPLSGAVVIEGGPGTGKTAVALHRVAYLLYTHRERLARSGVLVVGPSAGFIRYVGGVLPALGESAVVFTTPGRLAHGVVATAVDQDEVARTKGSLVMLDVLRRAVADRQELPRSPISIELDDVTVEIDRATAARARRRARATGLPHNAARKTFRDTRGFGGGEVVAAAEGLGVVGPKDALACGETRALQVDRLAVLTQRWTVAARLLRAPSVSGWSCPRTRSRVLSHPAHRSCPVLHGLDHRAAVEHDGCAWSARPFSRFTPPLWPTKRRKRHERAIHRGPVQAS